MKRERAALTGTGLEPSAVALTSSYEDALGKIKLSRETHQQAIEMGKKHGLNEMPVNLMAAEAVRDVSHGFVDSARHKASGSLSQSDSCSVRASAALVFAQIGDIAQAQKVIDGLQKEYPDDTRVKFVDAPVVQATILLHQKKATEAIAVLEPSRKYELERAGPHFGSSTFAAWRISSCAMARRLPRSFKKFWIIVAWTEPAHSFRWHC